MTQKPQAEIRNNLSAVCLGRMLLRKLWIIVAAAIFFGAGSCLHLFLFQKPVYRAVMTYAVVSTEADKGQADHIALTRDVTAAVQELLMTDMVTQKIREHNATLREFDGSICAVRAGESNLLTVALESADANEAVAVLQTVAQIFPSVMAYLSETCTVRIVQEPTVLAMSDPSAGAGKHILLAALLGATCTAVLLCWIFIRKGMAQTAAVGDTPEENGTADNEIQKIDLFAVGRQFRNTWKRFWILVCILTVVGAGISDLYAYGTYVPMYQASARFAVYAGAGNSFFEDQATQDLAKTLPDVLQTEWMQEMVRQELDTDRVNGTVRAEALAQSNLFELTVCSSDRKDAGAILQALLECYPKLAMHMADDPQIVIDCLSAEPTAPCNPFSWLRPTITGGIAGLAIGMGFLVGMAFLQNRYRCKTAEKIVNHSK